MAPCKRVVVVALGLLVTAVLVSGGQAVEAPPAPAPPPAPLLIRGAELGSFADGIRIAANVVVGDGYISCLEMGFSKCFGDLTFSCIEDAMVECSLQAAAAPAAATGPAAAPLAGGGGAAAELLLGGIIGRSIATVGANYINCLEADLVKCYSDPTIACVEKAMEAC